MKFGKKRWSKAKPCVVDGVKFPSKLEAKVYGDLSLEAKAERARLYRQIRFPLPNLAPDKYGKALVFTVDFMLIYPDNRVRVCDAKGRQSPEWLRGKKAFEAWYDVEVEEIKK